MLRDKKRRSFIFQPWIWLAGAGLSGASSSTAPLPAALLFCVWTLLFLLLHRPRRWEGAATFLLGTLLFMASAWRAREQLAAYRSNYHSLASGFREPKRCAGEAIITHSPIYRSQSTPAQAARTGRPGQSEEPRVFLQVEAKTLDCEGRALSGSLPLRLALKDHALYGQNPQQLARGDRLSFIAQLSRIQLFRNASLSNPWPSAARRQVLLSGSALYVQTSARGRGLSATIDHFRSKVRGRIAATYSPVIVPLGRALVLGDNDLPQDDAVAFRKSGLLHLLAVSGTHLVIFVLSIVQLLQTILVRIYALSCRFDVNRWSAALGAVLSLLYADFSGGSGSAFRAAYMMCIVCGSRACGIKTSAGAALGASVLLGLALDPLAQSDYSFLLSALATSGLIGLSQPILAWLKRWIPKWPGLAWLVESLAATVSSSIPCAPVLAMMDGQMTWAALFANVIAGPLGEVIALPACLLHALVSPLPAIESGLAHLGSGALFFVRQVALLSASVQSARFAVPFPHASSVSLMLCLILLFSYLRHVQPGRYSFFLALAPLAIAATTRALPAQPRPDSLDTRAHPLTITSLDVGQGDAHLIEFPNRSIALVDGGGFVGGGPDTAQRVLLPTLRSRNIGAIDLMILSHAHPDHLLGLLGVAESLPIRELWIPATQEAFPHQLAPPTQRLMELVADGGGHTVPSYELCGRTTIQGRTSLTVLAPCQAHDPPFGKNDASLVLRIAYGSHSALLTGDIEERGEQWLLETYGSALQSTLLKVGHHGSDTSSSPHFLHAVQADIAIISAGARNRFRHPRPITLDRLSSLNTEIWRTDQQGSITWISDGNEYQLRSFDPPQTQLTSNSVASAILQP